MEQKKNDMIVEMVEKLRQMDNSSLVIMKACDIDMDRECCQREAGGNGIYCTSGIR